MYVYLNGSKTYQTPVWVFIGKQKFGKQLYVIFIILQKLNFLLKILPDIARQNNTKS